MIKSPKIVFLAKMRLCCGIALLADLVVIRWRPRSNAPQQLDIASLVREDGFNFGSRARHGARFLRGSHNLIWNAVNRELANRPLRQERLHDLVEAEVKHGVRVHLYNVFDTTASNAADPVKGCCRHQV